MSDYWKRPKITISKTKSEWVWDIIGYIIYVSSILLLIFNWSVLPEKVPAHYNALGEVDRYGSKWELIILPCIGIFLLVFMQVLEKHPEAHNYPSRLNESNAQQFYLHSRKLMNKIKNICLIIFSCIIFESISLSLGWGYDFGMWLLPIIFIATGIPIILGIMGQRKIK
ncbi:DUF1648 domain-containing protein [Rummeliibacillus sp. NPDC094406]|uniref:DUF1648 domain-containing protein n=1 Tax=Rummeliibacillus sp. NPDC094406 TaxID=3364511 RepID=UPI00381080CE